VNSTPYQLHGNVAVITFDNPPMNGYSHALRLQIVAGIEQAEDDPEVGAIVLIGRRASSRAAPTSANSARRRCWPSRRCAR